MTYFDVNQLKYDLTDPYLRSWAYRYGIVDLALKILTFKEVYLGNVYVRRCELCANDLSILNKVKCWLDGINKYKIMNKEDVLLQLRKKFRCKNHPEDKNAIVIDGISLKDFEKICSQFRCSGHYVEERRVAVATNFGLYK